jgi:hypothetical protein
MLRLTMNIFLLVSTLLSLTFVAVNGQPSLLTTASFKTLNNYDINAAVLALSSQTVINNYVCMYTCINNSNCALAVLKSGNVCNVYSSSAINQVIPASSVNWIYQKQISG